VARRHTKSDPPGFNEQLWAELWDLLLLPDEEQVSNALARNRTDLEGVRNQEDDALNEITNPHDVTL